ncbi:MAG: hypothetical protein KDD35_02225 [Bdellovibrionales bacterium]|nr:hypothetical protein [Bdellovibrionales bacterium]
MNIMNYVASLGLMAFLFLIGGKAGAIADGPDCFKVKGVKSDDILNVRNQADGSSKIVGTIPYNGDGIANLTSTQHTGLYFNFCLQLELGG